MQPSIFQKLSSLLWTAIIAAVVLLAAYVSFGRYLSSNLQNWQEPILAQLNSRLPFHISASSLSGQWSSFTPEIVLKQLQVELPGDDARLLQLTGGRVGIDVIRSLVTRSLQVTSLQLDGLDLEAEVTEDGQIVIPGLSGGGGQLGDWLQAFLLNVEYVTLANNRLLLTLPGQRKRSLALALHMARDGSERRLRADLLSARGTSISLYGEGLGNPFEPRAFKTTAYLQVGVEDLSAVSDLLPVDVTVTAQGQLNAEFWLSWNAGDLDADMALSLAELILSPQQGEWSVPLDALSVRATLQEQHNRWTAFASDLRVAHDGVNIEVPRLQVDAWGDSLRLRTEALAMQPLNQLLANMPAAPQGLRSVFDTLNVRGEMTAVQIAVGDFSNPLANWSAEGNFDQVQVDSWSGAPGVTSGTGHFELSQRGGTVLIDSQQFTMDFPTVFEEPLYYDDFHGTLHLDWDADALLLRSGLISARAEEGEAEALFSLNIPFSDTDVGLEMGLLVGLADSRSSYRSKYLPYTLNTGLLDWLSSAIGEGDIQEAGFVWRGSLRPDASPLRTVQLMLNLENTALAYHPDWPPVADFKGTVLIDDARVSVWAEQAKLYESVVEHLSAETWMAGSTMQLAIDGRVNGSAADGLRAVNESLLGRITGGVFEPWEASGTLQTRLKLQLDLADSLAPPEVDVAVDFSDVDIVIAPGDLPVNAISGELSYTSRAGFSADGLTGKLWRRPLTAQIRQRPLRGVDTPFSMTDSAIEVALQGSVNSAGLQQWLTLPVLDAANGEADVNGLLTLIPGETSLLTLKSSLQGMAMNLPAPWLKTSVESLPLELALPLGADETVLGMALGEDVSLHLDITGGGLQAAALGLMAPPPELRAGKVRVQGQASLLDVEAWLDFIENYLLANGEPLADPAESPSSIASEELPEPGAFTLEVADLRVERLTLWGYEVNDVDVGLQWTEQGWLVEGATQWLRGEYEHTGQGPTQLRLEYLDISALDQLQSTPQSSEEKEGGAPFAKLPEVDVSIAELGRGEESLGAIDFRLQLPGDGMVADGIVGNIAGMELSAAAPGRFNWLAEEGSRLQLPLKVDDIGETLEQMGYARFVESRKGSVDVDLGWPGPPQDIALAKLEGAVLLELEKGRFLQTPSGAGALKVVEIFNLAGIVERLSMSQFFESGLSYETVDGEVFFHSGTLEVASLSVRGSASEFDVSGVSDIANRTLDGELVATLPVASNLPWVAALAAGPAVAAGVFVVSKVFEKQVDRLSSGVYGIKGTWDEPDIKFDRIFDDEMRARRTEPAPEQVPADVAAQPGLEAADKADIEENRPVAAPDQSSP